MNNRRYKVFKLHNIKTDNFLMTPLELKDYIDFVVKRVYFISNPTNQRSTGSHCHIDNEDELFVMLSGSCTIVVDDGHGIEEINLTAMEDAIRIPPLVWHHFKDISDNAIILALTSTNYDPERKGYCESYDEFKKLVSKTNT